MRTMTGVWVENQLSIRKVLLQDERVYRVDNHIIAASPEQGWLFDCL